MVTKKCVWARHSLDSDNVDVLKYIANYCTDCYHKGDIFIALYFEIGLGCAHDIAVAVAKSSERRRKMYMDLEW
jgi:hypothetical protein